MFYLVLIALIQGITEFLPISSSAHLILLPVLTQNEDQGIIIDVAAHFGTLLALLLYFWSDVKILIRGKIDFFLFKNTEARKFFLFIALSSLPVLFFGAMIKISGFDIFLRNLHIIAVNSIFWGFVLYICDKKEVTKENASFKDFVYLSLAQILALLPGTSRSGICMTMSRFLGFDRTYASKISILMAIPVLLIFGLYSLYELVTETENYGAEYLSSGLIVIFLSFIFALLTLYLFMNFIRKIGFLPFAIYRILLGALIIIYPFVF